MSKPRCPSSAWLARTAALALALLVAACGTVAEPLPRFAYVLDCDATLHKLDMASAQPVQRLELSGRDAAGVPAAPGSIDGCLATQVMFDAPRARVWFLSPDRARLASDGLRQYRALAYSVPQWQLQQVWPAGARTAEPPRLALDAQGQPQLAPDEPAAPGALERSGPWTLVRMPQHTGSAAPALGMWQQGQAQPRLLQGLPATSARHVHLAPGGEVIVVQETGLNGTATGEMVLFDSRSGQPLRRVGSAALAGAVWLGAAPGGTAILRLRGELRQLPLGQAFPNQPVQRLGGAPEPGLFFFER